MAGMDWFRWHHGSVNDPKFQLVARKAGSSVAEVIGVWATILEAASMADVRGCHGALDFEAIDCCLGLDDGKAEQIYTLMTARGLVDAETKTISSWAKRQPVREREDDKSTERVKAFREKKRQEEASNASETPRNAKKRLEESRVEKIPSVAKATGDESPPKPPKMDDKEKVFTYGVPILVNGGSTEKAARSFLGGLCKGHGDATVVQALRDCVREKPVQPLEWLAAALPPEGSEKRKPVETFRERDARLAREKVQAWTPGIAAKEPDFSKPFTIDEVSHVAAIESR